MLWTRNYGGHDIDAARSIQLTTDGGYVIAGYTDSFGAGNRDVYVVKLGPDTANFSVATRQIVLPSSFNISVYPNPFNPTTTISFSLSKASKVKLDVFDVTGRRVTTLINQTVQLGEHQAVLDGSGVPSGIYFARLQAGSYIKTQKMVLLK
jgi:hypothetical protein